MLFTQLVADHGASGRRSGAHRARTSGVYLRADPEDLRVLDGLDDRQRAELIAGRLRRWKSILNA